MSSSREWAVCKVLAVILCVVICMEAPVVLSGQEQSQLDKFASAKMDFVSGRNAAAKQKLEEIIKATDVSKAETRDFLGQAYALLGASCESLGLLESAKKHYRTAADLLAGQKPAVPGVSFSGLTVFDGMFGAGGQKKRDPLTESFIKGRDAYFNRRYEEARSVLEKLIKDLSAVSGRDSLRGQTYLVAGAAYEKLELKGTAIQYYCEAKTILGTGKTIPGLTLKELLYYGEKCPGESGVFAGPQVEAGRRSPTIGGVLRTLFYVAMLGGVIWFLFFSKNAPFKSLIGGSGASEYSSACFSTFWKFEGTVEWAPGQEGTLRLEPNVFPQPSQNNGWDDTVSYALTAVGGTANSVSLAFSLEVGGGNVAVRRDIVTVDGIEVLNAANTFSEACASPGKKTYENIYRRDGTGTFTIRHKVEFTR
jgi:hypothetical protein